MFLPYRTDLEFNRMPIVTIIVCVLCTVIFYQQTKSDFSVEKSAQAYCEQQHPRLFWLTLQKVTGDNTEAVCPKLFAAIYSTANPDQAIDKISTQAAPWDLMTSQESHEYTAQQLHLAYDTFSKDVHPSLTSQLEYNPASYNVWHMITAAFAHGSWSHLIGNLFFFYAFATTVEIIIGSSRFALMILYLAIGTHAVYAFSQYIAGSSVPTLGLSGVVMGVIGLFVYLLPHINIRCLLWLVIFWRVLRVPAWLLAAWYVGWDVYNLFHHTGGNVNLIAHVSGAALGYLGGVMFFKSRKEWAETQLQGTLAETVP